MPSRPKDRKNPKTANRYKAERAQLKRKSQVRDFKGYDMVYEGQKTGIKTDLVRSRSLK